MLPMKLKNKAIVDLLQTREEPMYHFDVHMLPMAIK